MNMNVKTAQVAITVQEVEEHQTAHVKLDTFVLEKPQSLIQLILQLEIYAHKVITVLQVLMNQPNVQKVL